MPLPLSSAFLFTTTCLCLFGASTIQSAEDLTAEQQARLLKAMPRTYAKMRQRQNVHVAVLGDTIVGMFQPGESPGKSDTLRAWHGVFLKKLANRFFLTGDVRELDPRVAKLNPRSLDAEMDLEQLPRPASALVAPTYGPEITMHTFWKTGGTAVGILQGISTDAFDNDPDLMIIMLGSQDALGGYSLKRYRDCLSAAAAACKARKVDLMIAAPPLVVSTGLRSNPREALALTRPFAQVARQVAAEAGAFFVDVGAAQLRTELGVEGGLPEETFNHVVQIVARDYEHGLSGDGVHPNLEAHARIGANAYAELLDGEPRELIQATGAINLKATADQDAELELTLTYPKEPITGVLVSFLEADRQWMPVAEKLDLLTTVGARTTLRVPVRKQKADPLQNGTRRDLHSGEDEFGRFSVIIHEGESSRIVDVQAAVLPVCVVFPTGLQEGVAGDLILSCSVVNPLPEPFAATVMPRWMGKDLAPFELKIDAGARKSVDLRIPMPEEAGMRYFKEELRLTLKAGSQSYVFAREIEARRNLALQETVPLIPSSECVAGVSSSKIKPVVMMSVDADAQSKGLYFTFTLPRSGNAPTSGAAPSAMVEISIDARGPSQRGKLGYVDVLRIDVPWEDEKNLKLRRPPVGVFGDGYDRELDRENFRASVTTQADGNRLVKLSIPWPYFYMHKRADGQATLGLNARVALLDVTPENTQGSFTPQRTFVHVAPGMSKFDAMGLAVLELQPKASGEWSVCIY